jgi:hypothetical protein
VPQLELRVAQPLQPELAAPRSRVAVAAQHEGCNNERQAAAGGRRVRHV